MAKNRKDKKQKKKSVNIMAPVAGVKNKGVLPGGPGPEEKKSK